MMSFPPARGVIFDLDGTLVDSGLDFDHMRAEMGLPPGRPILEAIAELPRWRAAACWEILDRHEQQGAARARPMPQAEQLLALLALHGMSLGVLTRNSRQAAQCCLERFSTPIEMLIARQDAPPKPDPLGILKICQHWHLAPAEVAMVGDYRFDIEVARHAGARAVLYTFGQSADEWAGFPPADYLLHTFAAANEFLSWLTQPI